MSTVNDVILASTSPRRRDLLAAAGIEFRIVDSQASEDLPDKAWSDPTTAAQMLAERKAATVIQMALAAADTLEKPTLVIGADTMVVLDGKVYGKPVSADDAKRMLRELSGHSHEVVTGVSVWAVERNSEGNVTVGHANFAETSIVHFKELSDEQISAYVEGGESFGKAGAYAIQGKGADLVERYEGDYDNIVGLPVRSLLERFPQLRD